MIPLSYWALAVGLLVGVVLGWWVGRGQLRAERALRRAAEADARVGTFAVGRAEVQSATAAALTGVVAADTGGQARLTPADPEMPPRVWLALPDSVPPAVFTDATMLAADHPPLAMTSVMRAEDLGDYAYATAVKVDDPDAQVLVAGARLPVVLEPDPDEPHDTEPVEDEPERPGPPPRIDDTDGSGTALVVEVPAPPATDHRHNWAYLGDPSLRPDKPWVPADPRLSRLTRLVVRRLRLRAWLTDPRGAAERLLQRPTRLAGRVKAGASWGWKPGQATALVGARVPASGEHRPRPAGRHRPGVVAAGRAGQPPQRPARALRHDWRDMLKPPRRADFSSLPNLDCTP